MFPIYSVRKSPHIFVAVVSVVIFGFSIRQSDSDSIDLQTCIGSFAVHRDKIIRTQDSQHMGAQYLNEIDLGARDECLRLCCETENCDVFVFEEKKSGSCYLFHCGPPEDFKCKFTHHVNYSSGILAVSRHLSDLESQIKLTKHEQDLIKLRKSELESEPLEIQTSPSTTTTTVKSKQVLPPEIKTKPPESEESRKCSRYQFECRSTGECIAIYNACDGIPQCADGSDEGPELGCPSSESFTTQFPSASVVQSRPINNNQQVAPPQQQQNLAARYESNNVVASSSSMMMHPLNPVINPPDYRNQINNQQQQQQEIVPPQLSMSSQQNQPDFLRPAMIPGGANNNPNVRFDQQMPQYGPQNSWVPHQSNQMPLQVPQYPDKNSHIFNHKESGLQVPDGQEISQIQSQYGDANARDYQKIHNYYEPNYRQQILNSPPEEPFNYQQLPQPPEIPPNLQQPVVEHKKGEELGNIKGNPKHEQEKMASELKNSKENVDQKPKIKIEKFNKLAHHHQQYPDVVAYKIDENSEPNDGIAETPGGAVLSLTLGLIITCILALLIGCRLRVKRRLRKGEKAYAHDADYLVNGMYL